MKIWNSILPKIVLIGSREYGIPRNDLEYKEMLKISFPLENIQINENSDFDTFHQFKLT